MTSLAGVARRLGDGGIGPHLLLGRGEETTGGRDKDSILADALEALIGAVHLGCGLDTAPARRAPAVRPDAGRGRHPRRRPGLEDQPAGARRRARARRPRATRSRTTAPTTRRRSPPPSSWPAPCYGRGTGRTKKAAEQEAAEAAWRRAPCRRTARRRSPTRVRCPSCPRSRSSAAAWRAGSPAAPSPPSRSTTPARSAGTSRAPTHFVAGADRARRSTAAHRRGKYLWLPLAEPDGDAVGPALVGHLGMSGQLLVEKPSAARRDAPARPVHASPTAAASCASSTSAPSAVWRVESRTGPATTACPAALAHIAIDPLDDGLRRRRASRAALRRRRTEVKRALLDQTLIGGVGNIYADEALWRARLHGARPTDKLTRAAGRRRCSTASATCWARRSRQGGTSLRLALRRRQRAERLLLALPRRLRAGGPALPALRDADPPRVVHEPLAATAARLPAAPARAGAREHVAWWRVVSGHVQGVGFRYFVRQLARASRAGRLGARICPTGGSRWSLEGADDDVPRGRWPRCRVRTRRGRSRR